MVIFRDQVAMFQVLRPPIPQEDLRLSFLRWRREAVADLVSMDWRLKIELLGIPSYLWLQSTAQSILGKACCVIACASETESKASMKAFKVFVGCVHPDLVPLEKFMLTPIPAHGEVEQSCLRY